MLHELREKSHVAINIHTVTRVMNIKFIAMMVDYLSLKRG